MSVLKRKWIKAVISTRAKTWHIWIMAAIVIVAAVFMIATARAETMRASFYGSEMGSHTASGARWRPMGLTCAHRTWRMGSHLRVTYRGRSQVCVVNDRGPARFTGRSLDMSRGMARAIGMEAAGVGIVDVERLD